MKACCDFCFRHCLIEEGGYGRCGVRTCRNGIVSDRHYGRLAAIAADPIEKKPLYHFLPGTETLSIAMTGCSFDCDFCQNHAIAKDELDYGIYTAPEKVAELAAEYRTPSVSFTYTEPLVWQDYMADVATLAKTAGLKTVMVTNGAFSEEALERIIPLIDAYNIDIKVDESFYREIVHGDIAPVLRAIKAISMHGSHIEATTMVIEGVHTLRMMESLAEKLADAGVSIWHITAFYPRRRMNDRRAASAGFIHHLIDSLEGKGIEHIYPGNI